jgi:4-diphosphocytidyl-2-C-methyl-D-erythritol kinase
MLFYPNVKINLGLRIRGKRPDGYHNLESIFIPVNGLTDILEIVPSEKDNFQVSGLAIDGPFESNLVFKALQLLRAEKEIGGCHIHLHKLLPMGAGLGGGSADGAFALKALNQVFNLGYNVSELQEKAALLGSDCPFFITNSPARVSGRGEVIEPITGLVFPENLWITIVHPGIHISTKEAFSGLNLATLFPVEYPLPIKLGFDWKAWQHFYQNHFQEGAVNNHHVLRNLVTELQDLNPNGFTAMTGSGSACYQISDTPIDLHSLKKKYTFVWQGKL